MSMLHPISPRRRAPGEESRPLRGWSWVPGGVGAPGSALRLMTSAPTALEGGGAGGGSVSLRCLLFVRRQCCVWTRGAVEWPACQDVSFLFFSFFFLHCNFFSHDSWRIREARGGWHTEDWGPAWLSRCAKTRLSDRRPLGMLDLCWELADVCFFVRIPPFPLFFSPLNEVPPYQRNNFKVGGLSSNGWKWCWFVTNQDNERAATWQHPALLSLGKAALQRAEQTNAAGMWRLAPGRTWLTVPSRTILSGRVWRGKNGVCKICEFNC